ncbi:hypothetical protein IQ22_03964 [Pseudomonas duriflava]|uniref:Uncharacterized protein n=1 Tax=Pseudomonas duriflava TaxID=459528 RepID=A0A562PYX6_9PSED|nr:hypothetical protein [Pseudomonas duriflava]TWI49641.1 hypothetical protein IQ22_03964 [Pseudomonas duriflava]
MNIDVQKTVALVSIETVKEFSSELIVLANVFQDELQRISRIDCEAAERSYGVLMEIYGLRTRANILFNDAVHHTVEGLDFTQQELMGLVEQVKYLMPSITTIKTANTIILSVATFSVALGEGRGKVVKFLMDNLKKQISVLSSSS